MITIRKEIEEWLNTYDIENYSINKDGSVYVDGNVNLHDKELEKIPVKFSKIKGYFDCSYNKLKDLGFCPNEIKDDFNCSRNNLTSLKYCPKEINGSFYCCYNELSSLEYCPKKINGDLVCSKNKLKSLEFLSKKIKNSLYIDNNPIKKELLYLFDSEIEGNIFSDLGNKEKFLFLVQEQKILFEKDKLISNLEKNEYSQLNKKRL